MIACIATILLADYNLESTDGGLVASGTLGQWEYAVAESGPAPSVGQQVWSTRPSGDTFNDTTEYLSVPLPDVSSLQRPVLVVQHAFELGLGDTARFELEVNGGVHPVAPIHGYPSGDSYRGASQGIVRSGIDLTGLPPGSTLRLRFDADAAGAGPGWALHDLQLFDGDPIPADVEVLDSPQDTQEISAGYEVVVAIDEDVDVLEAQLAWSVGTAVQRAQLLPTGPTYRASIPTQPPNTEVSWWVEVQDCNTTVATDPESFRVFLAAPEHLRGPEGRREVGGSVVLEWGPPPSPHHVLSYEVTELESGVVFSATDTAVEVELQPDWAQRFSVHALYDEGPGDESDVLQLHVEVPELSPLSPADAFPGDHLWVEIEGQSLYMLPSLSSVSFGVGAIVEVIEVLDVSRARVLLAIDEHALAGPRTVEVLGAYGVFRFPGAFEIRTDAQAPRITHISPDVIVQGSTTEIEITASREFGEEVVVVADEDIVLVRPPEIDGAKLRLTLKASGGAQAGAHTLILDDGYRLWEATLEVEVFRVPSVGFCEVGPSRAGWSGLILLACCPWWRRRSSRTEQ